MSASPITDEALEHARGILADLQAGHPAMADGTAREDLPIWQREQVSIWALNLESCLAQYVAGLLARLDAAETENLELRRQLGLADQHELAGLRRQLELAKSRQPEPEYGPWSGR